MFENIFVEKEFLGSKRVNNILKKTGHKDPIVIDKIEDHFGRFYKPYLHKRTNLNLYLGSKKGKIVKEAPPAYGKQGYPHYYFVHAYNCIYECEYCYLQGYFNSPDIVLYLNYEEITEEIHKTIKRHSEDQVIWFHAGEFSDSLALSHLTEEVDFYYKLFENLPNARLEFRTKSANIRKLMNVTPLDNVVVSYSLSPKKVSLEVDRKTPPLLTRLKAIKKLQDYGHKIGIHLDPIIYSETLESDYEELFHEMNKLEIDVNALEYISIGVVRFSKDVFRQFKNNYPDSPILKQEFITGEDQKMRMLKPLRLEILDRVKNIALNFIDCQEKIYLCME